MTETYDKENWLDIEDFPGYQVSDLGRVRNTNTLYVLSQHPNGRGRIQVVMYRDGKNTARAVHKLVAHAFICPPPEGAVAMHVNGDIYDNRADNLDYKQLWFVAARTRQAKRTIPIDPRPIVALKTGTIYPNALECAKTLGGLEKMVLSAARSRYNTHYLGTAFEYLHT